MTGFDILIIVLIGVSLILNIIMLIRFKGQNDNKNTLDIDYNESLEDFNNPERGFYTYLYYNFKVTGNEEPSEYLDGNLVHLRLGIGDFSKKVNGNQDLELSEDMLNMLDTILKIIN